MKILIVVLVVAIGLAGCASTGNHDSREFGFPKIYSGKSGSGSMLDRQNSSTCCTCCKEDDLYDAYKRKLPLAAKDALHKAGIKDIAFIAVVDSKGTIRLLNTDDFTIEKSNISEENPLHIDAVTLLKPISMMRYKGSHCFIWSDGQVVDVYGNVVVEGYGGPRTSGGSGESRICYWQHGAH